MKPAYKKHLFLSIITLALTIVITAVALYITSTTTDVLIVSFDGKDVVIKDLRNVSITLSFKHSVELVEVIEVYEIQNGSICVKELRWPPYGAGVPSSLKDLEFLKGQVEFTEEALVIKNLKLCLGRELRISMSHMLEPHFLINNVEVKEKAKEIIIKLIKENALNTLLRFILKLT